MAFTNSPLATVKMLSPNCNTPRNQPITKITPHHCASPNGITVEAILGIFVPVARQASTNYGIGTDGRIGLGVEERNRAWTSSSPANDHQAITIEVANDGGAPDWHVSDAALESLIALCTDICKRNKIPRLNFTGDSKGNLTFHSMFANTLCPGPYLQSKFPYIEQEVNRRLGVSSIPAPSKPVQPPTRPQGGFPYRVAITDPALNVRASASLSARVVTTVRKNEIYTITESIPEPSTGIVWLRLLSGAGWISENYTKRI